MCVCEREVGMCACMGETSLYIPRYNVCVCVCVCV